MRAGNVGTKNLPVILGHLLAAWAMLCGARPCIAQIRYFQTPTIPEAVAVVRPVPSAVRDSIVNDTVFQAFSGDGYPVYYYKKVRTSVCFDNKCRLLKCTLYWNITGRYLGFGLDKGEYLSKARHKPFKRAEYVRLNAILADASSALAGLSYGELAPRPIPAKGKQQVDAVTSATAKNILDEVVPGAAYTTYKMWHVIYGASQEEVRDLTIRSLSPALILKILDSPDPSDKIWALNHIRGHVRPDARLRERVISLIGDDRYNLAERAIHSLDKGELKSDTVQALLTGKLAAGSYALRKLIVGKLAEAPSLSQQTVTALSPVLAGTNPELTSNVLDLFTRHRIADTAIVGKAAALLATQNAFVARKAYQYLLALPVREPEISRQMERYQSGTP